MTRGTEIDTSAIDAAFVPVVRPGVASVELDGEGVVYDEGTSRTHLLNVTAQQIWARLDGSTPLAAVCQELGALYDVDADTIEPEVVDMVRSFGRLGLLDGVRAEASSLG